MPAQPTPAQPTPAQPTPAQPTPAQPTPDQPRVTVSVRDGVADVQLDRPEKLNAFDHAMFDSLVATGEALAADAQVRAVVISGAGRGFSAGLDLAMFGEMSAEAPEAPGSVGRRLVGERGDGPANHAQRAAWVWRELEVPVIAAVHGPAMGAGCQLALAADLRIVAPDAKLAILEIRWGLIPDMSGTYHLPRLVGPDVAKELLWSGRVVSGEEAVRIGMATQVAADPHAAALELAASIAARNPHAVRAGKRLIDASLGRGAEEQLRDEERTMVSLIGSPNQKEAVAAWFDKRDPVYADV